MNSFLRKALTITLLFLVMLALLAFDFGQNILPFEPKTLAAMGFILLTAYTVGELVQKLGPPKVVGYILTGIAFGPSLTHVLFGPEAKALFNNDVIRDLSLINKLALGLIGLTAGGELLIDQLKKDAKAIGGVLGTQTVVVSLCVGGAVIGLAYLYPPALPFLPQGGGFAVVLGAAMIFGSLAVGTSPATTLAVMSETRAQGPLKNLTLGLIIAKDVSTVTFYLLMLSIALVLTTGKPFELRVLKEIATELGGAIALGAILGGIFWTYIKWVKQERMLFTVGIVFLGNWLAAQFHAEALLLFIAAGFVVAHGDQIFDWLTSIWRGRKGGDLDAESHHDHDHDDHGDGHGHDGHGHGDGHHHRDVGHEMIHELERLSLPTFVVFFTIASAKLDLMAIPTFWIIALTYIVVRAVSMFGATQLGVKLIGGDEKVRKYLWYGMFAQAGVTLTIVEIAAGKGLSWASELQTIIMATILVNIIAGPTLLKIGLMRSGEAATPDDTTEGDEATDEAPSPEEDGGRQHQPVVHFPDPDFESQKLTEQLDRMRQRLRTIAAQIKEDALDERNARLEATLRQANKAILGVLDESLQQLKEVTRPIEALPPGTHRLPSEVTPPGADRKALKGMLREGRSRLAVVLRQLVEVEGPANIARDPVELTLQAVLDQVADLCAEQESYITIPQEDARFEPSEGDSMVGRGVKAAKRLGRAAGGFTTRTVPLMSLSRYHVELEVPRHLTDTAKLMGSQRLYVWQKILILYKMAEAIYIEGLEFLDDAPVLWKRSVEELFEQAERNAAAQTTEEDPEEEDEDSLEPTEAAIKALEAELRGVPDRLEPHRPASMELSDFFEARIRELRGSNESAGEFEHTRQDLMAYQTDVERSFGHALAVPYRGLLDAAHKAGTFELPSRHYNPSLKFDRSHKERLRMKDEAQNWRLLLQGFINRLELQLELTRVEAQLRQTLGGTLSGLERELLATMAYYPIELSERLRETRERLSPMLEPGAVEHAKLRKELGRERSLLMRFLHDTILEDIQEVRESRRFDDLLDGLRNGLREIAEGALPTIKIASSAITGVNSESAPASVTLQEIPLKDVLHEALEREVAAPLADADMRLKILLDRVLTEFTELGRVINFNLDAAASELSDPATSGANRRQPTKPAAGSPNRRETAASEITLAREFSLGGIERSLERLEGLTQHIDEVKELTDALILKETVKQIRRVRALFEDDSQSSIRTFLVQRDLTKASKLATERSSGVVSRARAGLKTFYDVRVEPLRSSLVEGVRRGLDAEEEDVGGRRAQSQATQLLELDEQLDAWGADALPNIYKRLFSPNLTELSDFFVTRPEVLDHFNRAVEQWLHGRFTTIAIVGEPGAGRQSFVEQALQSRLYGMSIIRRRLVHTISTEQELAEELSSIAGGRRTKSLTQLRAKLNRRRDRAVIILEGAENLFLRSLNGMETLRKFLHLVSDTGETLLWIITMDLHAWRYLEAVQRIGHQFTHPLVLRPMSRDELKEMILSRHRASGFKLVYTNKIEGWRQLRLMTAQLLNKTEDRQAVLEEAYFDKLHANSRGNPMLAIFHWMQSLQAESETTLRVTPLQPLGLEFLRTLDTEDLLALANIVLHNGLTAREFAEVFSTDEARAQATLQYLLHLRLVQIEPGTENMFKLNRVLYKAVAERLKQHNML